MCLTHRLASKLRSYRIGACRESALAAKPVGASLLAIGAARRQVRLMQTQRISLRRYRLKPSASTASMPAQLRLIHSITRAEKVRMA